MGLNFYIGDPKVVLCSIDLKVQKLLAERILLINIPSGSNFYVYGETISIWDENIGREDEGNSAK